MKSPIFLLLIACILISWLTVCYCSMTCIVLQTDD